MNRLRSIVFVFVFSNENQTLFAYLLFCVSSLIIRTILRMSTYDLELFKGNKIVVCKLCGINDKADFNRTCRFACYKLTRAAA